MTQQSRGGRGSHKHGVSGRPPPSPKYKAQRARDANALAEVEQARKVKPVMHANMQDLMKKSR